MIPCQESSNPTWAKTLSYHVFSFCRFIADTIRWMKSLSWWFFMAEAMELPMVALQSIKAGAMARLKGLSCHRLDGRGEWMLAI